MNPSLSKLLPVIVFFILINALAIIFGSSLSAAGFNMGFLLAANAILFLLTCFGFFIQLKGVRSTNPHAFVRGIYSSFLLKLFVIVGAILIYVLAMGGEVSGFSIFVSLGIYLVYTFLEVKQLMKLARKKPDA
jgi:hypothetical protein